MTLLQVGKINDEFVAKLLVGMWIVVNIFWVITWIFTGIKYVKFYLRKDKAHWERFPNRIYSDEFVYFFIDRFIVGIWLFILLIYLGFIISTYL